MGTASAGAPSCAGGDWFEQTPEPPAGPEPGRALVIGSNNPPSPRPAPSRAGRSCPRTFLPITSPNCLAASGGEQACALSVLAFDF